MAIRLKLNSEGKIESVEADEVQDALDFYKQVSRGTTGRRARRSPSSNGSFILRDDAQKLMNALLENPDGVPSHDLASQLGLKDPKGLGPIVSNLVRWAKRKHHLEKEQVIKKERKRIGDDQVRTLVLCEDFARVARK